MTKLMEVYKCNVCGNVVEVVHAGVGQLVCCGQPMQLMKENTVDAAQEKHIPVIEKTENGILVKVGSVPHPMLKEHYIEWIEVFSDGMSCRKFLSPGEKPVAEFDIEAEAVQAREFCNIHGLWKTE